MIMIGDIYLAFTATCAFTKIADVNNNNLCSVCVSEIDGWLQVCGHLQNIADFLVSCPQM